MHQERELIKLAQTGNMDAFRKLVEHHQKLILHLAFDLSGNMQDAEDISQEVFLKMYRSLKKFRGRAKLSTWLYRITVNTWINQTRRGNARLEKMSEPLDEEFDRKYAGSIESCEADPEEQADVALKSEKIRKSLELLSGRERSVFMLRHYHGLKMSEIGKTLNLSVGAVKSHLFRAVKKMQNRFQPISHGPGNGTLS